MNAPMGLGLVICVEIMNSDNAQNQVGATKMSKHLALHIFFPVGKRVYLSRFGLDT